MFECVYIMVCLADGRSIKIMTDLEKKIDENNGINEHFLYFFWYNINLFFVYFACDLNEKTCRTIFKRSR